MGLVLITNGFFSPEILYDGDDLQQIRFATLKDVELLEQIPLLESGFAGVVDLHSLSPRDITLLADITKKMHKNNNLYVFTSSKLIMDIRSKLTEKNVKYEYIDGRYLPKKYFYTYCESLGLYNEKTIEIIYSRMKGNLDSSQLVIYKCVNMGEDPSTMIAPRSSKQTIYFLAILLGQHATIPSKRAFAKVLRDEHPNYMRAILLSQATQLKKMIIDRDEIQLRDYNVRDKNISQKFFDKYLNIMRVISLPSLEIIIKRIRECRSKADLLLLHYSIKKGGFSFDEETEFVRFENPV